MRDTNFEKAYVPATAEHGWKTAMVVHAKRVGARPSDPTLAVASVHLKWGDPLASAALLAAAIGKRGHWSMPVVIGGDFNADVASLEREHIDASLLRAGLVRLPADAPTHSCGTIDHLYVAGVRLAPAVVGLVPPGPLGPWTEGCDGSDHAWVCVRLSL